MEQCKQKMCGVLLLLGSSFSLSYYHRSLFLFFLFLHLLPTNLSGLLHGNLSMHKVSFVTGLHGTDKDDDDDDDVVIDSQPNKRWALTDLTSSFDQENDGLYMAGISTNGTVNFSTGTFPPELFVKLNPSELKAYNSYWEAVRTLFNIDPDENVINPHVDPTTGDSYVLRCHYEPEEEEASIAAVRLPELPYKLVPCRQTCDVWAFGLMLFTFCSSGHTVFRVNIKDGHALAYDQIANWTGDKARQLVYKHVDDPLAQDVLLHLLSDYEERAALQIDAVLAHPFFTQRKKTMVKNGGNNGMNASHRQNDGDDENLDKITKQIVDLRSKESVAYKRQSHQAVANQAAGEWVSHRSKNIAIWNFDELKRFYLAPSHLLRETFSKAGKAPDVPLSALLLPYKLVRNKSGRFTPATKKDVERAERMGIKILSLGKAVHFVALISGAVGGVENEYKKWSSSELITAMGLPPSGFEELKSELVDLAAKEVEFFRDDPMLIARKIIEARIMDMLAFMEDTGVCYLYLVDEYNGIPVVDSGSLYPILINERIAQVFEHTLLMMHMCAMSACGVAGGIAGLVKLIFEAAYPHIPPSWALAGAGVPHKFDKASFTRDIMLLREATSLAFGSERVSGLDDLRFLQTFLELSDRNSTYANLTRVTNGESAIWTTIAGAEEIEKKAATERFDDACLADERKQQRYREQEERVKELERKLENMEFRLKHNLSHAVDDVD